MLRLSENDTESLNPLKFGGRIQAYLEGECIGLLGLNPLKFGGRIQARGGCILHGLPVLIP